MHINLQTYGGDKVKHGRDYVAVRLLEVHEH